MLQMKDLLREYGITISLSAPNAYDLLLQAVEGIEDEEISSLYLRLIDDSQLALQRQVKASIFDEESPFIDEVINTPTASPVHLNSSVAPDHSKPLSQGSPFVALPSHLDAARDVDSQQAFTEEEAGVFLEDEEERVPVAKRVALHTPRTGLLRCDRCQRTNTVMAGGSREETLELQCACGMVYRVSLDSRRFDRKLAKLPGSYVDRNNDAKTGTLIVENISFGGLKFRMTSPPQNITYNDLLDIQFTLDDKAQTLIREKVRVHYVHQDLVGAEFVDLNDLNRDLASYLMR
jgi:hypothetical protein